MPLLYNRGCSLLVPGFNKTGTLKSKVALTLFIDEKESCQCTIIYMVSAVNVFEPIWSQDNENEVDLMK